MASMLFRVAKQAAGARNQLLALTGVAAGVAAYSMDQDLQLPRLPNLFPVALAEAPKATTSETPAPSIALSGFEAVKDTNGFVAAALDKALRTAKDSPLQSLLGGSADPAGFYAKFEKQPLTEKVTMLDDVIDAVIREAERNAETAGLTVGMVGGGVACYALLGFWTDMAVPGSGTLTCSAVAGYAGHRAARNAAKKTRTRFLNAIMSSSASGANSFVDYLAAPSLDVKSKIASGTKPAAFFGDFFKAVQPLLKQVKDEASTVNFVNETAA